MDLRELLSYDSSSSSVFNESVSNESISNESASDESVSNESVSDESVSNESVSNESVSNESVSNESVHLEDLDFLEDELPVLTDDDGYDSAANNSDPEEILVDQRYPEPLPPPPPAVPFIMLDGEAKVAVNVNQRPRLEDRHHPYAKKMSRGYDTDPYVHTLRNALRKSEIIEGRATYNGFEYNLVPRRITGLTIKERKLFYFVEWSGIDNNRSFPLEAEVMSFLAPSLVIRFHQDMILNPRIFSNL